MHPFRLRTSLLCLSFVLLTSLALAVNPAFAAPLFGTVSGTIFRDYDENGTQGTYEPGIEGIIVAGSDDAGNSVNTTTDADGNYSLTGLLGDTVRVEVSLPTDNSLDYLQPAMAGGTTIQFVDTSGGDVDDVDAGFNNPVAYCQANPEVAIPYYTMGDPLPPGGAGDAPTLITFPYNANGSGMNDAIAGNRAIGPTWGQAYQRETQHLFSSAMLKRHIGLGPAGLGGIYVTDFSTTTPSATTFIDLAAAPYSLNLGTVPTNAARSLPTAPTQTSIDPLVYNSIGRVGLGDLDISDDDSTLYVVSINEKRPYAIVIDSDDNPATPPTANDVTPLAVPSLAPACTNGQYYPFGLEYHDGLLYMGGICNGETGTRNDLEAIVHRYNPTTPSAAPTEILRFNLAYPKGRPWDAPTAPTCMGVTGTGWNAWWTGTNTPPPPCFTDVILYPQPFFAGIEFDIDGSMIMGFGDRNEHQMGWLNRSPNASDTRTYRVFTGGDILRAYNNDGTFVLENNGTAGPNTTAGANNNEGPGSGEYYYDERYVPGHLETSHGGLVLVPGRGEVGVAVMDPINIFAGGVLWMNNTTAARTHAYEVYVTSGGNGTLGKGGGVGEMEVLCDPAPVEIGNRIWSDTNNDGVQDAGEAGIAGVVVGLYDISATLVATATTDSDGTYLFSNDASRTDTPSANHGISELTSVGDYSVGILATNFASGALLEPYQASPAATTSATLDSTCLAEPIGSGATLSPYSADFSTTGAGHNNHTLDCGFHAHVALGNYLWEDANADGIQDAAESPIVGATVACYLDADNDNVPDSTAPVLTDTTDSDGHYTCAPLTPDHYLVVVAATNFDAGGVLEGYFATSGGADPDTSDSNTDSNCAAGGVTTAGGVSGIFAPATTLAYLAEPIGDETGGSAGQDSNGNGTVDCGFYQQMALGNTIWEDADADGQQDMGELPLADVDVACYLDADNDNVPDSTTSVATDTTDAAGNYLCTSLIPGHYVVVIAGSNFDAGGALEGYFTSPGGSDPDTDSSNIDSNCAVGGTTTSGGVTGVFVASITLATGDEPLGDETNGPAGADANGNGTVDCGFYRQVAIGNYIWQDVNANGQQDSGESPIAGVVVWCHQDSNNDNIPDSTTPSQTATTDGNGLYSCSGFTPDSYVAVIAQSNFEVGGVLHNLLATTGGADPDTVASNSDSNCAAGGTTTSGGVTGVFVPSTTLTSGGEPTGDGTAGPAGDDDTGNGTVDCGFTTAPTAVSLDTLTVSHTAVPKALWEIAVGVAVAGLIVYGHLRFSRRA